ncbi:hypothetical protein L9F63_004314, partial [Diploptera punctata]
THSDSLPPTLHDTETIPIVDVNTFSRLLRSLIFRHWCRVQVLTLLLFNYTKRRPEIR